MSANPSSKTLLARARFLESGPREVKCKALSLSQTLTAVLAMGVAPSRRARLERVHSLLVARTPAHFEDPGELLRKACLLVRDDAERKHVPIIAHCTCRAVRVRGTFAEAISCLLDNAIHANRTGEPVIIDVHESDDHVALWEIHDAGSGMSPLVLAHLGDPCTARSAGLGVALANAIIQEHDGTLRFESLEGVGTTASVLLPTSS